MAISAVSQTKNLDAATQAKIDLAAAHRLAVLHEFEEGIDNHFTVTVPEHDSRYLVLPFGLHWSEARASDMIVFDEPGNTLEGTGDVELSARCIHGPIHRLTGSRVVLHTHQPWALALNMLEDNRLLPASQTAAYFHGHIAYDDVYSGTADDIEEGERLADLMGNKHVMFMKNHGVLVVGETIAQAYRRLYKLERVCRAQLLAMSSGQPLNILSSDVIEQVQTPAENDQHSPSDREHLFFEAMKRVLDQKLPGYAS